MLQHNFLAHNKALPSAIFRLEDKLLQLRKTSLQCCQLSSGLFALIRSSNIKLQFDIKLTSKLKYNMYLSVEGHLVACLRAADCHDVTISSSFVIVSLFLGTMFPSPFWSPVTLTGNRNSHIHILNNRYSSSIGDF